MGNPQSANDSFGKELCEALHLDYDKKNIDYLYSYLVDKNPYNSKEDIIEWLNYLNKENHLSVDIAPLSMLEKWSFNEQSGNLTHDNRGFFEIRGLKCITNWGNVREWDQPIIYQPEIGILGIITKKINGILYFLLQAKIEPGNINGYQLSPTVQATRSNYNQVHGGKSTLYLDHFKNNKNKTLYDQLQSEQGTRFYKKRNRNIIIQVGDGTLNEIESNFCWLTLRQINSLLKYDNLINMDTRSVISCIDLIPNKLKSSQEIDRDRISKIIKGNISISSSQLENCTDFIHSSHPNSYSYHPLKELIGKFTKHKFDYYNNTILKPLNQLSSWSYDNGSISHSTKKYFSIIGVRVKAEGREVSFWDQPIIEQKFQGTIGFLKKYINGSIHVLVHYKMECGFADSFEIAPTVQCVAENYPVGNYPPYYIDIIDDNSFCNKFDTYQSEEGGRFYKESNRNIIKLVDSSFPIDEHHGYFWVTVNQLKTFVQYTNIISIEARNLISCMGVY